MIGWWPSRVAATRRTTPALPSQQVAKVKNQAQGSDERQPLDDPVAARPFSTRSRCTCRMGTPRPIRSMNRASTLRAPSEQQRVTADKTTGIALQGTILRRRSEQQRQCRPSNHPRGIDPVCALRPCAPSTPSANAATWPAVRTNLTALTSESGRNNAPDDHPMRRHSYCPHTATVVAPPTRGPRTGRCHPSALHST